MRLFIVFSDERITGKQRCLPYDCQILTVRQKEPGRPAAVNDLKGVPGAFPAVSMKKVFAAVLAIFITCSGCLKKTNDAAAKNESYKTYYESAASGNSFLSSSDYYSVTATMAELPDGKYTYYIFIDDPQIALYSITAIAVENGVEYSDTNKIMPSSGIFDTKYSMIPNQVNKDAGYVKGIVLSGETDQPEVDLRLLIEWKDKTGKDTYREFLQVKPVLPQESQENEGEEYTEEENEEESEE